jgi:UDP-N-acetylglucosamine 2-epimerase (non-hydrolysing)
MIHILIGTKAQLIKMAPVMREMQLRGIEYNFVFSGQHNETIKDIRTNFGVKEPDFLLYSGKDITSIPQILFWFCKVLGKGFFQKSRMFRKDHTGIILNHGDTFSALLGSLLGKIGGLKTGHIESGLRSFKLFHPFPEEITRLLVFKLTDYFYCPGEWAVENVRSYKGEVINTRENTLYDALGLSASFAEPVDCPVTPFAIATLHRYENVFNRVQLTRLVEIIERIAVRIRVLFIMHPPTQKNLLKHGLYERLAGNIMIELRPRYDYFRFISLLKKAEFVISDGGSNQEECFYLGKPCLLLRYATERKEGLEKNVVLSCFDDKLINDFVENYSRYKIEPYHVTTGPSKLIVDSLIENGFAR